MKYSSFNIRALPGNGILRILFLFLLYGAFSCKSRQAAVTVIPTDSVVSNAVAGDKIGVESPAPPQDTSTAELQETYWKLTELMGKSIGPTPADKKEMNIVFSKDGNKVTGFAGCNGFMGTYELKGPGQIKFNGIASTKMSCPDIDTEMSFLEALGTADNFTINGTQLSLNRARMAPLARFQAVYHNR